MYRQGRLRWVLATAAGLGLAACGMDTAETGGGGGPIPVDAGTAGRAIDASLQVCSPGETQICYGPGACEGAQRCELHGLSWGPCDCGVSGLGGAGNQPTEPSSAGSAGAGGDAVDGSSGVSGRAGAPSTSSCEDGVPNGDETDVDCGGGTCPACAAGMACRTGADCTSGSCTDDACDAA